MVVDDQVAFRKAAIALVAATEGFEVVGEAGTGEAAVHQAAGAGPLLVLMDINMPGMDGIQAARLIRRSRPEAVLLLMSTYDVADLPSEASRCGAAGYVHKKLLDSDVLRQAWRSHLTVR
jgi:DNA-binding NarL/FixJ family response regulator